MWIGRVKCAILSELCKEKKLQNAWRAYGEASLKERLSE